MSSEDASPNGLTFNSSGTKLYVVGAGNDSVYQYSLSTAFDLSTASYDSVSLNVSGQTANPIVIVFNTDGTKLFMGGITNDSVYQYSLSTAFDLSTASYDTVSLSTSTQDGGTVAGLSFNGDGTKMYVVGYDNDSVYQYKLSTSFDLSTASYDNVSFSVASQDTTPRSVVFNGDGTKMYIGGDTNNTIYQYSTVIATASLDLSTGNYFNHTLTENTEFPLSNAGDVQAFQLEVTGGAVGYDLASASYDSVSFSVEGQESAPNGLFFKSDGTKVYVVGATGDDINQYTLSTAWDVSTASF